MAGPSLGSDLGGVNVEYGRYRGWWNARIGPVFLIGFGSLLAIGGGVDLLERDLGSWMAGLFTGLFGIFLIAVVGMSRSRLSRWRTALAYVLAIPLPIVWVLRTFDGSNTPLRWAFDAFWLIAGALFVFLGVDVYRRERAARRAKVG